MHTIYIVNEIQNQTVIPVTYTDEASAYSKYYTIMAAAAVSQVEYHGAHIIKCDGVNQLIIEARMYDRRTNNV